MSKTIDPELLQTILMEIAISNAKPDSFLPPNTHDEFREDIRVIFDGIEDTLKYKEMDEVENEDDLGFYDWLSSGESEDTNLEIYNSVIDVMSICLNWLKWIRER